jgi:hypothetical protein
MQIITARKKVRMIPCDDRAHFMEGFAAARVRIAAICGGLKPAATDIRSLRDLVNHKKKLEFSEPKGQRKDL